MNKNLENKKRAFIFQGVGSDYKGFLDRLDSKQLDLLAEYSAMAYEEIGMKLSDYLHSSKADRYDSMFYDWIAIYTCDYIVYKTYRDLGIKPDIMLGYSMGLITALTCGNSIAYKTGLHMLLCIYEYPKAFDKGDESMGVIIGKTCEEVKDIISHMEAESEVFVSSINNDTCIVLSGKRNSLHKILTSAAAEGAIKAALINAPYAFHSDYAAKGIEAFENFIRNSVVFDSEVPVLSALNQRVITGAQDIKDELVKNMTSPMNWRDSILKLCGLVEGIVEVSLDDSLTKMSRIINIDFEFLNYKKIRKAYGIRTD